MIRNKLKNTENKWNEVSGNGYEKISNNPTLYQNDSEIVLCEFCYYNSEMADTGVLIKMLPNIYNFLLKDYGSLSKGLFLGFNNNIYVYIKGTILKMWLEHLKFNANSTSLLIENRVNYPLQFFISSNKSDKSKTIKKRSKK